MDQQVPLSLGVSAAILEYVIFCHQEESAWPLSEPSILKKRFDEIFEALKYTNALEQIKSVRKDQLVTVKVDTAHLEAFKLNKERAAGIQAKSDGLHEQIGQFRERISSLDKQMKEALKEQNELFQSGQGFERILADLDKFRHERSILQETLRDLAKNIEEYVETDEELQDMKANFTVNAAKVDGVIAGIRMQESAARSDIETIRYELENLVKDEGRLRAEAEQYEAQLARREETIKALSRTHNIRGFDMSLDESQIADFKDRLNTMVKVQSQRLERVRREGRAKESELNADLQTLQSRSTEFESTKNNARAQIQTAERKLQETRAQLDQNTSLSTDLTAQEEELHLIEAQIVKTRGDLDKSEWDAQIRQRNHRTREIEDKVDIVNHEISVGNRQADVRAKLGLLKADLRKKEDTIAMLIRSHQSTFVEITGKALESNTMQDELRIATTTNDREIEEHEKASEIASREVSQLEAQLSLNKTNFKTKKQEEVKLKEQLLQCFGDVDNIDAQMTEFQKDLEKAQSVLHQAQFAEKFYDAATRHAEQSNCCQLCTRQFQKDFTSEDFKSVMEHKKTVLPRAVNSARENIQIITEDLQRAKDLVPVRSQLSVLQMELPKLEAIVKSLQDQLTQAVSRADVSTDSLQKVKRIAKELTNLDRGLQELVRSQRDSVDLKRQIANIESDLQSSGSIRSIDDMQAEVSALQDENRQVKRELQQLNLDKENTKNKIATLDGKRRDIQLSLSELHGRLRDKQNIVSRVEEYQDTIAKLNRTIEEAQAKAAETLPEITRLRGEFEDLQNYNNDIENTAQRETSRITASQNSLLAADADINAYLAKGGPAALRECALKIGTVRKRLEDAETARTKITDDIASREKQKNSMETAERQIDDNLRLRKVRNDIQRIEGNITALMAKNAERDRDQYIADSKRMKDKYSSLITERATLLGQVTALDNELANHQKELETEFKDADEVYRRQLIKVRTMEKANEDLEKYGKALDNAIMKYHSLKMEEINKIIDELWKATYCGTDVDTIFIKSEGESKISNRSYNYRVCMVKGEAELDMRGRCSAGQKVLAAIIIRLALAECFGINCGILALDEPTTNLDRENIESLAKSLANIISVRRAQKNFQLIVITHDEEFLRMMGCSDYCDYYFRVSRNEHQKSIIERQRVSTVL